MYCNKYTFYMIELIFIILQNCDYINAYIKLEKEGDFNSLSEIFNHILNLKKGRASPKYEFQLYDPYSTKIKDLIKDRSDENFDQIAVVIFDNDYSKGNLENTNGIFSLKDKYQYDGLNLKKIMELARKLDVETEGSKENDIINLERSGEHDQLAEDYTSSELTSARTLRIGSEQMASYNEDSFENGSGRIFAIILQRRPFLRSYTVENPAIALKPLITRPELSMKAIESDTDVSEATSEENESGQFSDFKLTSQQKSMLRKKWRASCDKKAAKVCRKACDTARKNTCHSYRCRRSLTKTFKKECKRSCKINFLGKESKSDSD